MRTIVDLPEDDVRWLDAHGASRSKSRAAVIREAVAKYRAADMDWLEAGFGAWKDRTDIGDGLELQRRMRAEWTREWDPDYEEVKAEYPNLFDDREGRREAAE